MKIGVCSQALYHLSYADAIATAARLGAGAIELPVDTGSPFVDLDRALAGDWRRLRDEAGEAGLEISCLSNHQEGQLLLGPAADLQHVFAGPAAAQSAWASEQMAKTGELAAMMGVKTVVGFTGCEDYSRWFPWPLEDGYERMHERFRSVMMPVLDRFSDVGVRFAHECHPKQFAFNLETALLALSLVDDHTAFGFNFDPGNLVLAGMEPVTFISELGHRIWNVHAKDAERVEHNVARSGLHAVGLWHRRNRGFRFRVCGWGDLDWRRLISELQMADYAGVLSIEHEDPTMSQHEGLVQAFRHLDPLVLREQRPQTARWW